MKYILAISGGVDSVVLLHMIARRRILTDAVFPDDFVVAHFDHGVRGADSTHDAEFVRDLAASYGVEFVLGRAKLSPNCSEELARKKRYEFLYSNDNEDVLVTAHHADDLLETILINLIRGTGWRGLAPMQNVRVVRPLLYMTKVEIVQYAIDNGLEWVEDITNFSPNYFRNRLRDLTYKMSPETRTEMMNLYRKQRILREEIENILGDMSSDGEIIIDRDFLRDLPESVAMEVLRTATNGKLTRPQMERTIKFATTAKPAKKMQYKHVDISVTKKTISVIKYFA